MKVVILRSIQDGIKKLKCFYCEKSFLVKSHLQKHMRKHIREKLYQCRFCDKACMGKVILRFI